MNSTAFQAQDQAIDPQLKRFLEPHGNLKIMNLAAPIALIGLAAIGCAFFVAPTPAKPKALKKVTYAADVASILNKNCVECHRPGEVAPFSLIGYDNAKKWSRMIAQVTTTRQMPPWKAVDGFGEFRDAKRLSASDLETLKAWDANGAPRGNAKDEPKVSGFASEWALGTPDLVLQPSKPFNLPSEGTDLYRNFVIKNEFPEARWVKAMDVKPGNTKVVHHVIVYLDNQGMSQKLEAKNTDGQEGYTRFGGVGFMPSGSLGGWAPGLRPHKTPDGTAFKVAPGATIVVQVHYHLSGKPETDQTRVGVYFAKEPIEKEVLLSWNFNFNIDIPAGEKNYRAEFNRTIPAPITVYAVMPHMHLLGKSMKAIATTPDGKVIPLVYIDDWDFNWQMNYVLKEPLHLPKGSKIHIDAVYDNSADNPRNPNSPPQEVTFGEMTKDEMFLMIAAYTVDKP